MAHSVDIDTVPVKPPITPYILQPETIFLMAEADYYKLKLTFE